MKSPKIYTVSDLIAALQREPGKMPPIVGGFGVSLPVLKRIKVRRFWVQERDESGNLVKAPRYFPAVPEGDKLIGGEIVDAVAITAPNPTVKEGDS
jgi:hypothetical protein